MVSFVEVKKDSKSKSNRDPERLDLEILAIGKRSGLSFDEINLFRVSDLFDYAGVYLGKSNNKPRKANQKDINAFYAN